MPFGESMWTTDSFCKHCGVWQKVLLPLLQVVRSGVTCYQFWSGRLSFLFQTLYKGPQKAIFLLFCSTIFSHLFPYIWPLAGPNVAEKKAAIAGKASGRVRDGFGKLLLWEMQVFVQVGVASKCARGDRQTYSETFIFWKCTFLMPEGAKNAHLRPDGRRVNCLRSLLSGLGFAGESLPPIIRMPCRRPGEPLQIAIKSSGRLR